MASAETRSLPSRVSFHAHYIAFENEIRRMKLPLRSDTWYGVYLATSELHGVSFNDELMLSITLTKLF